MGYYDEDENRLRQPKEKKGRFFLTSLIGAIIGALLVILAVPTLSNYGLLPYSVQPTNQVQVQENKGNTRTTQNVSLKVNTDVTRRLKKRVMPLLELPIFKRLASGRKKVTVRKLEPDLVSSTKRKMAKPLL